MPLTGFSAHQENFGTLPDGNAVAMITLRQQPWATSAGYSASITNFGGRLLGFTGPDRHGIEANIVCGPATLADCLADSSYAGAIIGRYANRIADASFALDGCRHQLVANHGSNTSHGGAKGFDRALWRIMMAEAGPECAFVELAHLSPHGDQGFPGNLEVRARYTLYAGGRLQLDFSATTDRPTVVSLTCHPYFNLAGAKNPQPSGCLNHRLHIPATHFLPISAQSVPEGASCEVAGTPFDFRERHSVGERIANASSQLSRAGGYDHYFPIDAALPSATAPVLHAVLQEPLQGRQLKILSTLPGLQFYTGNFLGKSEENLANEQPENYLLPYRSALCLEPQFPPDAPNRRDFPSTRLMPGETWRHAIVYELGAAP